MSEVESHYENLLSEIYTWIYGGFESAADGNRDFFARHAIKPTLSGIALDLGAGSGFQTIPLAELGFRVRALDLSDALLRELREHADRLKSNLEIETIRDDILNLRAHCPEPVELIVCMTDTLNHLESWDAVRELLQNVHDALESGGRFIATFRDLSRRLDNLDRFIPVRGDENRIFTCFLEYENETVKVHDLVHRRGPSGWEFHKSVYRKLILAPTRLEGEIRSTGLTVDLHEMENGLTTIIARKK